MNRLQCINLPIFLLDSRCKEKFREIAISPSPRYLLKKTISLLDGREDDNYAVLEEVRRGCTCPTSSCPARALARTAMKHAPNLALCPPCPVDGEPAYEVLEIHRRGRVLAILSALHSASESMSCLLALQNLIDGWVDVCADW